MRILHVITTINRGGAENHLVDLVRNQKLDGFQVSVAFLKGDGYWERAFKEMGISVECLALRRYGELGPALRLCRLINHFNPSIVHAHMPPAELYVRIALMLPSSGRPALVISKHNDEPFYRGVGARWLSRFVADRASRIIAISDAVNAYVRQYVRLASEQVVTIRYGIDPVPYKTFSNDAILAVRSEWGVPSDAWLVGTVARLVPQKALHVLLTGYANYRKYATKPARLLLVGRGPLEEELKELAKKLGISDEVIWAGYREDIPLVMNTIDCFALTSIYEGFGLVLLEAMAASKPIVATAVSAIPEVVTHNETGILCDVNNAQALGEAFLRMEKDDIREVFGAAGNRRALELFTLEKMVSQTKTIYLECS